MSGIGGGGASGVVVVVVVGGGWGGGEGGVPEGVGLVGGCQLGVWEGVLRGGRTEGGWSMGSERSIVGELWRGDEVVCSLDCWLGGFLGGGWKNAVLSIESAWKREVSGCRCG